MAAPETTAPRELIHTVFERVDNRDANGLLPFLVDDVVEEWPMVGRLEGSAAVRDHFAAIFASMPDFHIDIERMAADGESVFVHWHVIGTFTGAPFNGIVATGRPIDLRGTDCFTVRNGKIVTNFIAYDGMRFAVQAGILPAPGTRTDGAMTAAINVITRARRQLRRLTGSLRR
jgi:steroid delta-isomerase-like uncharacterized protein